MADEQCDDTVPSVDVTQPEGDLAGEVVAGGAVGRDGEGVGHGAFPFVAE